jgi:hypothetical protein
MAARDHALEVLLDRVRSLGLGTQVRLAAQVGAAVDREVLPDAERLEEVPAQRGFHDRNGLRAQLGVEHVPARLVDAEERELVASDLAPERGFERRHVDVLGAELDRPAERAPIRPHPPPDPGGRLEHQTPPLLHPLERRLCELAPQGQPRDAGPDDDAVVDEVAGRLAALFPPEAGERNERHESAELAEDLSSVHRCPP